MKKMEAYCKENQVEIPCEYISKGVGDCMLCQQSQPSKSQHNFKSALARKPMEDSNLI